MDKEEQAKSTNADNSLDEVKENGADPDEESQLEAKIPELEGELKSLEDEEGKYVLLHQDEDVLTEEQLKAKAELLDEQIEQAKLRIETNRRAVKLGYLKLANQARRCSHLRNDGEPCRAPAMGNREFCVFHSRGYDCETNQRIKFGFLEDDGSLQLVLKQIMEQVLSGRIPPQTAALLLRGTQIANGVLKARKSTLAQRKPVRSATQRSQRNPEEFAG